MSQPLNPVRPGTQAELTEHLAATIGNDVERAMQSVGWAYTDAPPSVPQEPVNPEQAQTAQTPPAESVKTTDNPIVQAPAVAPNAIDWEAYKDKNGLIMGKYRDADAAIKGMHSLLHMANTALSERDLAQQEATELRHRLQTPVREPSPAKPTSIDTDQYSVPELEDVRSKLKAGEGLDADEALKLIDGMTKHSERIAQKVVQTEREREQAVKDSWLRVDDYMNQHYPVSMQHADEMTLFSRTNPEVGRVFNRMLSMAATDEQARIDATVYLWKEYSSANPHLLTSPVDPTAQAKEHQLQVQAQVRKEEVDEARKHAGLLGNMASGVHETTANTGTTQEDIDRAAQYMKQTADGRLWRELTIGKDLKGPWFENN